MRLLILFLMLCISAFQYAQESLSISGIVYSEDQVISDAYVTIGTQGGITDSTGNFEFLYETQSLPQQIRIDVSALGYRTQQFEYSIYSTDFDNLEIQLSLFPEISEQTALNDIQKGKIQFLLAGGIAPVVYASDANFTKKYGVSFYEFGCEVIATEALESYNQTVASFLDQKFGKKWRRKVRPDIVGVNL